MSCLILNATTNIYDKYFNFASKYYNIDINLLKSIAKIESNFNPNVVNTNVNGSTDIGIMQINTIHLEELKKYHISKNDLFNPKINISVGAWILSKCINKYGINKSGINCYNGRIKNNNYYKNIFKIYSENIKYINYSLEDNLIIY